MAGRGLPCRDILTFPSQRLFCQFSGPVPATKCKSKVPIQPQPGQADGHLGTPERCDSRGLGKLKGSLSLPGRPRGVRAQPSRPLFLSAELLQRAAFRGANSPSHAELPSTTIWYPFSSPGSATSGTCPALWRSRLRPVSISAHHVPVSFCCGFYGPHLLNC